MSNFEKDKYSFVNSPSIALVDNEMVKKRQDELSLLYEELKEYRILIRDLRNNNFNLEERNKILNIAYFVIENKRIFDFFIEKRILPIKNISKKTRVSTDTLEKWSDYIITYSLILSNEKFNTLKTYLKIEEAEQEIKENIKEKTFKGILVDKKKNKGIIITSTGDVKRIKIKGDEELGQELQGEESKGIGKFKYVFIAISAVILILAGGLVYNYTSISKIIVIESNIQVKVEINNFDRAIRITSSSEEGDILIQEIKADDKSIDWTLCKIIEYQIDKELISTEGIFITVSGEPIEYGTLQQTSSLIEKEELNVIINNGGRVQSLTML